MSGPSNRVEPRFFGAPELYNNPKKKEPLWTEENNPPPPYTPNEPATSSVPTNASAPPLELSPDYYPTNQYGTMPNNTSDVGRNWPWVAPVNRAPPESPVVYPPNNGLDRYKKKSYLNGVQFAGSTCLHGTPWLDIPKEIEFNAGLKVRVIGGSLSSGKITIKSITSESRNGITQGTVHATALVSPASLIYNSDLSFSVSQFANGTTLEFYLPQDLPSHACVRLDAVIYVPSHTPYLALDVQNTQIIISDETLQIERFGIQTTNAVIEMFSSWKGKELGFQTTNGHIEFYQPIDIDGTIVLTTTNAAIHIREPIFATELIYLMTTNGAIDIDKQVNCKQATRLITSNGHIYATNVTGDTIEVRTSNGRIKVDHSHAITSFDVQSTNAKIDVKLDSGNSVLAMLRTSNGEINAIFPNHFEGSIEIGTNAFNKVALIDPLGWIKLDRITKNQVIGTRYSFNNNDDDDDKKEGEIHMGTSNANIKLAFLE